jgi:hypothetical protein
MVAIELVKPGLDGAVSEVLPRSIFAAINNS